MVTITSEWIAATDKAFKEFLTHYKIEDETQRIMCEAFFWKQLRDNLKAEGENVQAQD